MSITDPQQEQRKSPEASDADVIGAIHLALLATTEQRTLRRVLETILDRYWTGSEPSTGSLSLLLQAVQDTKSDLKIRIKGGGDES